MDRVRAIGPTPSRLGDRPRAGRRLDRPGPRRAGYSGAPLSHMSALALHRIVDAEVTRLDVTVSGEPASAELSVAAGASEPERCSGRPERGGCPSPRWPARWSTAGVTLTAHLPGGDMSTSLVELFSGPPGSGGPRPPSSWRSWTSAPSCRDGRPWPSSIGFIAGGCESELEIFGVRHVLAVPGIPPCEQQYRLLLRDGPVRLDAAWPDVKLAVELDGAAFHGSPEARERDLRRDAALAALGWVVLRFSYRRLMREPAACRAEILAAYRQRASVAP